MWCVAGSQGWQCAGLSARNGCQHVYFLCTGAPLCNMLLTCGSAHQCAYTKPQCTDLLNYHQCMVSYSKTGTHCDTTICQISIIVELHLYAPHCKISCSNSLWNVDITCAFGFSYQVDKGRSAAYESNLLRSRSLILQLLFMLTGWCGSSPCSKSLYVCLCCHTSRCTADFCGHTSVQLSPYRC